MLVRFSVFLLVRLEHVGQDGRERNLTPPFTRLRAQQVQRAPDLDNFLAVRVVELLIRALDRSLLPARWFAAVDVGDVLQLPRDRDDFAVQVDRAPRETETLPLPHTG